MSTKTPTDVGDAPPSAKPAKKAAPEKQTPDTYWLLEGVTLLLLNVLGGLFVQGEENVPQSGPVLMVANHTSYLDPVSIGDASPRRVVFMAKAQLFKIKPLNFLLRGVDSFPVKRGEADRGAFKNTLAMLGENRVVCIFPEGTRMKDDVLGDAEAGAAVFAIKTGCPVVPVFVSGANKMLDWNGKLHRARVTVAFGTPFTFPKNADRDVSAKELMTAIAKTRDEWASKPSRRIYPHWIKKKKEGRRAKNAGLETNPVS